MTPASGNWYNGGTVVTLAETPASGFTFVNYSNSGGALSGNTITMSGPATVTANFTAPPVNHIITSIPTGLAITVDAGSCTTPCTYSWVPGFSHTVAAAGTEAGATGVQYVYASWSDGGAASQSVTASFAGATFTANYTTQFYLTTAASPSAGGTVTPASGWYTSGTGVTVTATPAPATAYHFSNFGGGLTGTTNPQSLTMSVATSVTGYFALPATTTTLQTLANPSAYSPNVSLTATVSPGAAAGSVTFYDGSVLLGTVSVSGGVATMNATTLGVGVHVLSASYGGSSSYGASSSAGFSLTVNQAAQTITFNPGSTPMSSGVAIPATVSSGLPLSFSSGTPTVCTITGIYMNLLAQGPCTITVSQAGNANYLPAASVTQTFMVTPALQSISFFPPGNPPAAKRTATAIPHMGNAVLVRRIAAVQDQRADPRVLRPVLPCTGLRGRRRSTR